jgi:hypothetical protein
MLRQNGSKHKKHYVDVQKTNWTDIFIIMLALSFLVGTLFSTVNIGFVMINSSSECHSFYAGLEPIVFFINIAYVLVSLAFLALVMDGYESKLERYYVKSNGDIAKKGVRK